jgi:DNA-binding SARP family transcriptional activator
LFLTPQTVEQYARQALGQKALALNHHTDEVHLRILGDLAVVTGEGIIRPPGRIGLAIAFLATRRGTTHLEEIIDALWPETTADRGRVRLRNVLARIRQSAGHIVIRHGDQIRLAADVVVDADVFEAEATEAIGQADIRKAAELARTAISRYGGELLPTLKYEDWTAGPRERLRSLFLLLLDLLAADAHHRGERNQAVAYLERAISQDPYDEERYLRGARFLFEQGRLGPARRLIDRAKAVMVELGLPASAEVINLERQLRTANVPTILTKSNNQ